MSDNIGNIDYSEAHEGYQGYTGGFSVSTKTKELIEEEVRGLIEDGYVEARRILTENQEEWERLAQGLLEYETLTGDEIKKVMAGEPIGKDDDAGGSAAPGLPSVTALPKTKPAAKGDDPAPEPLA